MCTETVRSEDRGRARAVAETDRNRRAAELCQLALTHPLGPHGVRDLVSWWSNITLEPGDVITSGAPAGVIAGRENPVWLTPGDRIEAAMREPSPLPPSRKGRGKWLDIP